MCVILVPANKCIDGLILDASLDEDMASVVTRDPSRERLPRSFISKLHYSISRGLPHAEPVLSSRVDELDLVRGILQMLQGPFSSLFTWEAAESRFSVKSGVFVPHLSQTSLTAILNRFLYSAECLQEVECFVRKVRASGRRVPTLDAFATAVLLWLQKLRGAALEEEQACAGYSPGKTFTLLGLTNDLSSLCSRAECLLQVVYGAIPNAYFNSEASVPASEIAVHILDYLFKKLNEICLVQRGEDESYNMVLAIFSGSVLPYLKGLDSWIYNGNFDDPYEELFFHANGSVAIDQPAFWENSYILRSWKCREGRDSFSSSILNSEPTMNSRREVGYQEPISMSYLRGRNNFDKKSVVCPAFLLELIRAIMSAGKSLQLVWHLNEEFVDSCENIKTPDRRLKNENLVGNLSLDEVFLVSLSSLINGDCLGNSVEEVVEISECIHDNLKPSSITGEDSHDSARRENLFFKFLVDKVPSISCNGFLRDINCSSIYGNARHIVESSGKKCSMELDTRSELDIMMVEKTKASLYNSFYPENPVLTVCKEFLGKNIMSCEKINISRDSHLPPLNDLELRQAVFGELSVDSSCNSNPESKGTLPRPSGTDYAFGFQFSEIERLHSTADANTLKSLFPFPTILPNFQDKLPVSDFLPFQKSSTLASKFLDWILSIKPKDMLLPAVIIQECLSVHIQRQVDFVGKHMLGKLMSDWRLMDELNVLRAIYLLGSGDILQQFLITIFDKLDRGDMLDDDFELNTLLQESIRNSADGDLLVSPETLVVSITKCNSSDEEEHQTSHPSTPHKNLNLCLGIDSLDTLNFSYKVSWPLNLIANLEAIKKYNQVMGFLLKVRRAKFVLDKSRRWMWKSRGRSGQIHKRHLLVEQKLLHFVDAFHQYVMDRVFHSAWVELCSGMSSSCSLDEVIEVHEAYLLSIQRQCFVAPDKLWALIASRVKSILGLALDFYSIQQTLNIGGAAPAIKMRCELEVDRIEKQFDECIAFLLRILSFKLNVGHFPHLADLVTRINYNYYYMSDSGNLLTIPGLETVSSKIGRTSSVSRTD